MHKYPCFQTYFNKYSRNCNTIDLQLIFQVANEVYFYFCSLIIFEKSPEKKYLVTVEEQEIERGLRVVYKNPKLENRHV